MKNRAAVSLGRRGGRVKSAAKAAAARENGKKGGRPLRYRVWIYGEHFDYATIPAAEKAAARARSYCDSVQILEIETGRLLTKLPY